MDIDEFSNRFSDELENIHNKTCGCDVPETPLYHYTNAEGLKGILESKRIWFSKSVYLNDPGEIVYGKNYIFSLLEEYEKTYVFISMVKKFINMVIKEHYCNFYVCSFCKKSDYLPAWRYYGDNGSGFAIEFSVNFFDVEEKIDGTTNKAVMTRILYDHLSGQKAQNIKCLLKELLKKTRQGLEKIDKIFPDASKDEARQCALAILSSHLLSLFPMIKHPDYETEEEHRLFVTELVYNGRLLSPPLDDKVFERSESPRKCKKIRLKTIFPNVERCTESVEVSYIKKIYQPNDIQKIYVGPACNNDFDQIKLQLKNLLPKAKWQHLEIEKSVKRYVP